MEISEKQIKMNSLLLGLYVSMSMLTKVITSIYSFENNIILVTGLIFLVSLGINKLKMNPIFIMFNFIILILILISYYRLADVTYLFDYLNNYLVFGFIATYLISFKLKFPLVMKTVNLIFVIFTIILVLIYIPMIKTSTNLDFTMDLSYTSMIGVCSVFLSYKYYKEEKWSLLVNLLSLCINMWYLIILSNNRGALFTLMVLCFLLVVSKLKRMTTKILLIITSIIASLIFINNLEHYLTKIYSLYLSVFNFRINWLERFLYQISRDDIMTGRDLLYKDAYRIFADNPIIGSGVGFFELSHNGQYPHNFVLQLLGESGIIFSSVVFLVIIIGLMYIIKSDLTDSTEFLRFFFILSIPRLLISSTYWELQFFWLYLFLCLIFIMGRLAKKKLLNFEVRYATE
jgi:hypothetical protein